MINKKKRAWFYSIDLPGIGERRIVTDAAKGTRDLWSSRKFTGKQRGEEEEEEEEEEEQVFRFLLDLVETFLSR